MTDKERSEKSDKPNQDTKKGAGTNKNEAKKSEQKNSAEKAQDQKK